MTSHQITKKEFSKKNKTKDIYKIPRKNLIFESTDKTKENVSNQNNLKTNLDSNTPPQTTLTAGKTLSQIQNASLGLLKELVNTGQKISKQREERLKQRRQLRLQRRMKQLKKIKQKKAKKLRQRKAFLGPSEEEQQQLEFKQQEHSFKFVAQQTEWEGMRILHRAATAFRLMPRTIDTFGNNYYQKLDHLEISLMDYFGMEHEHVEEMENELHEDELNHDEDMEDENLKAQNEQMLVEKEKLLNKQQEELEMEERMEKDIHMLKRQDVLEDPESPISKENMQKVHQQLDDMQKSMQELKSDVDDHQKNEKMLQDEIHEELQKHGEISDDSKVTTEQDETSSKSEKPDDSHEDEVPKVEKKTALEGQVESMQQQIRAMQHQLGVMHEKQGVLDKEMEETSEVDDSENSDQDN
jgi:hypothetical protein